MNKGLSLLTAALLIFSATAFVGAQTTTTTVTKTPTTVTKTVQHPDGTYTVIEYPVGKEVKLTLNPVTLTKSKGVATILRDDDGTKIVLNLTDVPADVTSVNLYAVDDTGVVTALGPVAVSNGTGTLTATTPLNKFMLIAAPDAALTAYDPNTKVFFRSAVPKGFALIPHTTAAAAVTTPATVTTTPTAVTITPTAVTTTPAVTITPTSVTTTPAAVTTTPTAVTTTPAAVTTTPAAVAVTTTPAAVTITPTAVTTTPAAVTTTPATVITTPAAVTTTPAAVTTTPAVTITPAAVTTTPATVITTPATVTETVQNPDGTYSVIEYPVGKEVALDLTPVTITGAKGVATILRDDAGTRIKLNLTDLPSDVTTLNLYAVDSAGATTLLGPITVTNGVGTFTSTTPLNKFMLIAAPDAALTAYDPNTKVFFRSAVPEGFAVIPHTMSPVGEKVSATTATPAGAYSVPMLNIPAYTKGDDTKIKVNFSGALTGARANVFITPKKGGATKVKMRFHELKEAPAGKVYTVWAISPDNSFVKLGQIVNTGGKNEAEIQSEVALPDFGLLVTMEDANATTIVSPVGPSIGIVEIVR